MAQGFGFPYFQVSRTVPGFVRALRKAAPSGDLEVWLTTAVGLKASVARGELPTLERLGWVREGRVSERGFGLRGEHARPVAVETLQAHYAPLVQLAEAHPDSISDSIGSWLQTNTTLGEVARSRILRTFLDIWTIAETGEPRMDPAPKRQAAERPRRVAPRTPTHGTTGDVDKAGSEDATLATPPNVRDISFGLASGGLVRLQTPMVLTRADLDIIRGLVALLEKSIPTEPHP